MQIPSLGQSGYQLLQRSNQQAAESAQEIASAVNNTQAPNEPTEAAPGQQTEEVESSESSSVTDALVGLQQAEHYTRAGVKVLQAEGATIGRLLDIQV